MEDHHAYDTLLFMKALRDRLQREVDRLTSAISYLELNLDRSRKQSSH